MIRLSWICTEALTITTSPPGPWRITPIFPEFLLVLPAGAFANIHELTEPLYSIYGTLVPSSTVMDVHFGALDGFQFEYGLMAIAISGQGQVSIDGITYEIGSIALDERLSARDVPVDAIIVHTTGTDNVITYLLNPVRFDLDNSVDVQLVDVVGDLDLKVSTGVTQGDHAPNIAGDTTGDVTEAGGVGNATPGASVASGDLNFTDVDNPDDWWQPVAGAASVNGFGTYQVTAAGVWTYTLDDGNAAVNALQGSATLTDSFSAVTSDGSTELVTVTIHAQNDAAVITGSATGDVAKSVSTAGGDLTSVDVDDINNSWLAVAAGTASVNGFGTYQLTAAGVWTYTLDESNAAVNALRGSATLTDSFSAVTSDGTTELVSITIRAYIVAGPATGDVTEAGGTIMQRRAARLRPATWTLPMSTSATPGLRSPPARPASTASAPIS